MDEEYPATEVRANFAFRQSLLFRANFAFDIDSSNQELTLWQEGKSITLTYWECLLLFNILDKNLNK